MAEHDQTIAIAIRTRLAAHFSDLGWEIVQCSDDREAAVLHAQAWKQGSSRRATAEPYPVGDVSADTAELDYVAQSIADDILEKLEQMGELQGLGDHSR